MSYGVPCLASDIPENREVVGNHAVLFRNKDVDDLAKQMNWAFSNGGAIADLAQKGQQRVQKLFTWESVVDQLETLYKRVAFGVKQQDPNWALQQPAA
jgi:glycosyltransferase involved in cell wall biosynthesis